MATHESVSHRDALDIVFANRNRAYGAYQLRRAYTRYLGRALGIGLLFIGFGIALPQILNALSHKFAKPVYVDMIREIGPPPVIENTPPTTATASAYSATADASHRQICPPTPTPDELVREEQPPAQDDLLNAEAEVSNKNRESNCEAPPSLDDVSDFPTEIGTSGTKADETEYNMVTVQKPPTFPGGEQELLKYLAENIKYPPLARETNIQGTVALSFVIGKDGRVSDVSILKDIGGGCGKEAVRVVESMPRWSPGEASGYPVKVRFTLPVKFRLQ